MSATVLFRSVISQLKRGGERRNRRRATCRWRRRSLGVQRLEDRRVLSAAFVQQDQVVGDRVEDVGVQNGAQVANAVAIDGDVAVVGAPRHDVNGIYLSGAAFVYRRSDNGTPDDQSDDVWQQEARLTAADPQFIAEFGGSVAISNETIVVGSSADHVDTDRDGDVDVYYAGSAYVFTFHSASEQWSQQQKLIAANPHRLDHFGFSVAISEGTIVAGSRRDEPYVFTLDSTTGQWSRQQKLTGVGPNAFGYGATTMAISGETIVVGNLHDGVDTDGDGVVDVHGAGSASVFTFDDGDGVWSEQQRLTASDPQRNDLFGHSVAISGGTIVAGSIYDDVDADGDSLDDVPRAGSTYVFRTDGATLEQEAKLLAVRRESGPEANAGFGRTVAVHGDLMVVGAFVESVNALTNAGSAYVYHRNDNGTPLNQSDDYWEQEARLTAADPRSRDWFGSSVAIFGETIVVGSPGDDLDTDGDGDVDAYQAGYASVFTFDSTRGQWSQQQTITASDPKTDANFGNSVAFSRGTLVVGSLWDHLDTDGDGVDDLPYAGSAYVFVDPPPEVQSVEVGGDLQSFIVQLNDDDLYRLPAEDPSNYRITAAGADAVFGTDDDVTLAIDSISYDPATDRLAVRTADPLFDDYFRLEIDSDDAGNNADGVTDIVGNYLAGGDFTADFDLTSLNLAEDLLTKVESLGLSTSTENSLTGKLDAVLTQLEMNVGDDQSLTAKLDAFINGVNYWYEKDEITLDLRDDLIEDAEFILLGLSLT